MSRTRHYREDLESFLEHVHCLLGVSLIKEEDTRVVQFDCEIHHVGMNK